MSVDKELTVRNPAASSNRYPVTQEQIDDILANELKDIDFPVKPTYNSRIRDNGRTVGEFYAWGQLKEIRKIEVGRQDKPDRNFLIDTLLHEYYEADIMKNQYSNEFYRSLSKLNNEKRHEWINDKISEFLESLEGTL